MKCSELIRRIQQHIDAHGDGYVVLSQDRQPPELRPEGADCLVIEQRVTQDFITEEDLD